jgi:hypothetical protein
MVPGKRALAFAARWFDSSTVSNVFEPLIADWQREWRDAAGFARFGVRIRGGSALLVSMIAASPTILLAPWPTRARRRVLTRIAIWTTIVTTLTVAPFIVAFPRNLDAAVFLYLLVLLLPQAVAIALPFAVTTIVDLIRTAPRPTREERIAAVRIAIATCSLMLILAGWVYPATNQQFRVISLQIVTGATTRGPAPGFNEMSLTDLARDNAFRRESWTEGRAEAVARQLGSRLVLIAGPAALIWIRWRALRLPRGRRYSTLPLVLSAPISIGMLYTLLAESRGIADTLFAPRWSGPWLALAVMVAGSAAVDQLRHRAARRELRSPS